MRTISQLEERVINSSIKAVEQGVKGVFFGCGTCAPAACLVYVFVCADSDHFHLLPGESVQMSRRTHRRLFWRGWLSLGARLQERFSCVNKSQQRAFSFLDGGRQTLGRTGTGHPTPKKIYKKQWMFPKTDRARGRSSTLNGVTFHTAVADFALLGFTTIVEGQLYSTATSSLSVKHATARSLKR